MALFLYNCTYTEKMRQEMAEFCFNVRLTFTMYRVIQSDCWGFNNLSYTIHLR